MDRLLDGIDESAWRLVSPREGPARSTLVLLRGHTDRQTRLAFEALGDAGVDVAVRAGAVRVSPHLHNTDADIDRLLDVLDDVAARRSRANRVS